MSETEATSARDEPIAVMEIAEPQPSSLTLWGQASSISTPRGAIVTLLHDIPVHGPGGEVIGVTKKPVAYFMMLADDLIGTAEMLIRQSILWAGQYGAHGSQTEIVEQLTAAIEDGRSRAEAIRHKRAESGEADVGNG